MAELEQDPSKLDIFNWMAKNWAGMGANAALSPYHTIQELMKHGYTPGAAVGQPDIKGITNAADVAKMLMGTGAVTGAATAGAQTAGTELGAFKASLKGTKPTYWTPDKVDRLKSTIQRFEGQPGKIKNVIREFRANNPDYVSSDSALQTMIARTNSWGGVNRETGAIGVPNPSFGSPGSAGGIFGKDSPVFKWTPEAENHLMGLHQNYPKGAMGRDRIIEEEFRKQYPNWEGRPSDLTKKLNKFEDNSGGTSLGVNSMPTTADIIKILQRQGMPSGQET